MDYSKINLFQMMSGKMAYLSARQDQLATNIANADTPGYAPKDIAEPDFESLVQRQSHALPVAVTNKKHIAQSMAAHAAYRSNKMRETYAITPMKNGVVYEEQMAMMAQNQMDYVKVTNLYNKFTGLFKIAIGKN